MIYYNKKEVKDMRPLKVKAIVIEEFNDSKNNGDLQELDKVLDLDYGRFEQLRALGKVKEYKEPAKIKKEDVNENSNTFKIK